MFFINVHISMPSLESDGEEAEGEQEVVAAKEELLRL